MKLDKQPSLQPYLTELAVTWYKTKPQLTHRQAIDAFTRTIQRLEQQIQHNDPGYYKLVADKFIEAYNVIESTVVYDDYSSDLLATYGWLVGFIRGIESGGA